MGEQAGGLGYREVLLAQLLEGDGVEVDRSAPGAGTGGVDGARGRRRRGRLRPGWQRRRCGWLRRRRRGGGGVGAGAGGGVGGADGGVGGCGGRRRAAGVRVERGLRRQLRLGCEPCMERTTACSASAARRSASRARSSASATLCCISRRRCWRPSSSERSPSSRFASAARCSAALVRSSICRRRSSASAIERSCAWRSSCSFCSALRRSGTGAMRRGWRRLALVLSPFGLGADPLLLLAHLLDLVADPLLGHGGVVLGRRGRHLTADRRRHLWHGGGTGAAGGGTSSSGRHRCGRRRARRLDGRRAPPACASSRSRAARAAASRCSARAASRFCLPPPYLMPKKLFCLGSRPRAPARAAGPAAAVDRRCRRLATAAALGGALFLAAFDLLAALLPLLVAFGALFLAHPPAPVLRALRLSGRRPLRAGSGHRRRRRGGGTVGHFGRRRRGLGRRQCAVAAVRCPGLQSERRPRGRRGRSGRRSSRRRRGPFFSFSLAAPLADAHDQQEQKDGGEQGDDEVLGVVADVVAGFVRNDSRRRSRARPWPRRRARGSTTRGANGSACPCILACDAADASLKESLQRTYVRDAGGAFSASGP